MQKITENTKRMKETLHDTIWGISNVIVTFLLLGFFAWTIHIIQQENLFTWQIILITGFITGFLIHYPLTRMIKYINNKPPTKTMGDNCF